MLKTKILNKFSQYINKLPLFQKISLIYTGLFSASFLILSLFISFSIFFFFSVFNHLEVKNLTSAIKTHIQNGNEINEENMKQYTLKSYAEINIYENISDEYQLLIYSNRNVPFKKSDFNRDENLKEPNKQIELVMNNANINNVKFIYRESQAYYNGKNFTVQVLKMVDQDGTRLIFIYTIFLISNVVGIIFSFIMGRFLSRRLLEPIKSIRDTAERITVEDLSQRLDTSGPDDELKELAVTFNDMFERLENSFKKQNQFVSDASHELRTPISVIQGYANLIDRWGKTDSAILQESIDSIKSETEHMSILVKRLLLLAKGDQNKISIQKEKIKLKELAYEISREIEIMEISQNFILNDYTEDICIIGDYSFIKQMLWIFIENSIKYTAKDCSIYLEIYNDDTYVYLSVKDTGNGISSEDIPFIFDRFYRVDKSRNKEIPGTGLGLSIAKWIALQHNTDIKVDSSEKGTNMTVKFKIDK